MTAIEFQHKLINLESSLERFAYSLTLNREDAKDLVQDTFLKALVYKDKFVHNDNFKAWTYTIMKNTFINNYRRNVRQNTHRDQTKEAFYLNHPKASGFDDPDSAFSTKELTHNVEQLEDEFRIPFKMHHEGYKYKEIAEELNLNIGTVKSRIFFSRKKLINRLNDYAA
jgi:RNA polymerase sigma-70 factor (ECF subfamily)